VLEARARGLGPVAVFDFDVHHGNGTEDVLKGVEGVAFASVHQGDTYPGTGQADVGPNCFNYPLPGGTPRNTWRRTLETAWQRLLATQPRLIGISAGFDAYTKPVLFLRGSLSDYLVPAVHEEMIARLFPKAQIHTVEGSNHWIHFDNPAKFVEEVVTFVASPDRSA
jgi:pimeloyl-ACP methyl ester carboxylesterase